MGELKANCIFLSIDCIRPCNAKCSKFEGIEPTPSESFSVILLFFHPVFRFGLAPSLPLPIRSQSCLASLLNKTRPRFRVKWRIRRKVLLRSSCGQALGLASGLRSSYFLASSLSVPQFATCTGKLSKKRQGRNSKCDKDRTGCHRQFVLIIRTRKALSAVRSSICVRKL